MWLPPLLKILGTSMMVHICNPIAQEVKVDVWVQGQIGYAEGENLV